MEWFCSKAVNIRLKLIATTDQINDKLNLRIYNNILLLLVIKYKFLLDDGELDAEIEDEFNDSKFNLCR